MEIDTQRIRALLDKRDDIDKELTEAFSGQQAKKTITCSLCKAEGHTARTCPQKPQG